MIKIFRIVIFCFLFSLCTGPQTWASVISVDLQARLNMIGPEDEIPIIITLRDRLNPQAFSSLPKKLRQRQLITALRNKADVSQKKVIQLMAKHKARRVRSLWLINGVALSAKASLIRKLSRHPAVAEIKTDAYIPLNQEQRGATPLQEWNIDAIGAPDLWSSGFTGQGVVVATMDSGVDLSHPDLVDRWRGGGNSWYDPNGEHASPHDATGHGTQVMGLLVGGDAGGSAIGVAPGAQWIAVKIFNDQDEAPLSSIHLGYQWLLDPDDDPLTSDAPDIVNNSWGLSDRINECLNEFLPDIQMLKNAGIAVVFSAGNKGPNPATSVSPANYAESFVVGATNFTDTVAFFSSRGPSPCDNGIFPDVVAPGVSIRSADLTSFNGFPNQNPYTNVTGTSFAAPQVSGAMALLASAAPEATVLELESALRQSAWDQGPSGPDNDYGAGFVDVRQALLLLPGVNLCIADINGDGDVDGSDLGTFVAESGRTDCSETSPCFADVNSDGAVDSIDFSLFITSWGQTGCLP